MKNIHHERARNYYQQKTHYQLIPKLVSRANVQYTWQTPQVDRGSHTYGHDINVLLLFRK